jgi:hypothetical protein
MRREFRNALVREDPGTPGFDVVSSLAYALAPSAAEDDVGYCRRKDPAPQYWFPNSGSTGFSNSDASRVTIVSPEGVTKYRRLSSTGS